MWRMCSSAQNVRQKVYSSSILEWPWKVEHVPSLYLLVVHPDHRYCNVSKQHHPAGFPPIALQPFGCLDIESTEDDGRRWMEFVTQQRQSRLAQIEFSKQLWDLEGISKKPHVGFHFITTSRREQHLSSPYWAFIKPRRISLFY